MRKIQNLDLGGGNILQIKELSIREMHSIINKVESGTPYLQLVSDVISLCTGLDKEKVLDLSVSEIALIKKAVEDVNKDFLLIPDWLNQIGLGEWWETIKKDFHAGMKPKTEAKKQEDPVVPPPKMEKS